MSNVWDEPVISRSVTHFSTHKWSHIKIIGLPFYEFSIHALEPTDAAVQEVPYAIESRVLCNIIWWILDQV